MNEKSFQDAKENPDIRQGYIDSLDLNGYGNFVSIIRYNPQCIHHTYKLQDEQICTTHLMHTDHHILSVMGIRGFRSGIEIYPDAFEHECVEAEEDFFSALFDHEMQHARTAYFMPRDIWPTLIKARRVWISCLWKAVNSTISEREFDIGDELNKIMAEYSPQYILHEIEIRSSQIRAIEEGRRNASRRFLGECRKALDNYRQFIL